MYLSKNLNTTGVIVPSKARYKASVENKEEPLDKSQTQPLHDEQVKNNAGGYVFQVSDMVHLKRFLFLGTEKGSYYMNEADLTKQNVESLEKLVKGGHGAEILELLLEIEKDNRIAKPSTMLFTLAYMAKLGDTDLKKKVFSSMGKFIRMPTHLFEFLEYCQAISKNSKNSKGWGRLQRDFVNEWYGNKPVEQLAYQVTKYQQRNGWSHRDVFRLAHVQPKSSVAERQNERELVYKYIVKKELNEDEKWNATQTWNFLLAFQNLQKMVDADKEDEVVEMIKRYKFVREHVPTQQLNSVKVWTALLEDMPLGAMIRNLNKMTKLGMFDGFNNENVKFVAGKLTDEDALKKARIHPLKLIVANVTYNKGKGDKGSLTWSPHPTISDALNDAYYKSFKYVEPTGKRFLIGLDVSGSMGFTTCVGTNMTPREGAACLALTLMKSEPNVIVKGFAHQFINVPISPNRRLDDNIGVMHRTDFGATDLALPIKYALEKEMPVDCFVILSDNETYYGAKHPSEYLRAYRKKMGVDARYVNIQMSSNKFSVADPEDLHTLEIAGFDSGMLETINEFLSWELV
jgi:60 kDa SS-A/Ro ribonucleoprotein